MLENQALAIYISDPYRIQTCNLLIRSQMLYSVELASLIKDVGADGVFSTNRHLHPYVGADGFEPPTLCL